MCTVLKIQGSEGILLLKNHDIFYEDGMIFTNKRGTLKSALIMPPETPLQWISKFGSITFSQCGKEIPVGGMNEAGLVVEQTTLPETVYSSEAEGNAVGELQAIQYLLDTCCNVAEAIEALEKVRIAQATWTMHYVLFDKSGDMAVVEYIEGEKRVYHNDGLPIKALTNSRYDKSLDLYETKADLIEFNNEYEQNSLERFIKAASLTEEASSYTVEEAFMALREVNRPDTAWSIVYQPSALAVHFTTQKKPQIKSITLGNIDFSRESNSLAYKLSGPDKGDITSSLMQYSSELNGELIWNLYRNSVIQSVLKVSIPDELLNYLKLYPEILEK